MGAGIAYEFRLREPQMYEAYKKLCDQKALDIGKLWIYNSNNKVFNYQKILNFPTKRNWKYPSKEEYLYKGLEKFVSTYKEKNITSIAFPLLGADKGGIKPIKSLEIMKSYLEKCDINIEIWKFDPTAKDDLYEKFVDIFSKIDIERIKLDTKIDLGKLKLIETSFLDKNINSISGLLKIKGIGEKTLEKLFNYIINFDTRQKSLFD
jgi:O-acetyl-ADP-ribose deacetylase (regulator of RNase III)